MERGSLFYTLAAIHEPWPSYEFRCPGYVSMFLRKGEIQLDMDHGIPFRRKVAEGGEK